MTILDTLFGLIPAESRGQQWVAGDLQLVNWGGYDGAHRVRFSPGATLLCGGSGSGKSTLMDAYIALMMPHTTPFNGASNGGVTGRPRGEEQRNILSYARGKLDESRTDNGTRMRVLRGDGEDTWTAVAMTWIDHDDTEFTAVRAWYIPATARTLDDTIKVRATRSGSFDLSTLEDAAGQRLSDASLRSAGLDTYPTDREFTAKLHQILGIGAAGAGAKAMSLLARIQAGQQITTVDELYKRMVLEEPDTLATADAVVAHFDELESTRQRMLTAQRQVQTLRPIRRLRTQIDESAERLRLLDEIGTFTDESSLASLWRATRRLELLREVESELQHKKLAADAETRSQQALAQAAETECDGLEEVYRNAGGDRIERAERDLRLVETKLETVRRERARFDEAVQQLDETVNTEAQFARLTQRAREALADAHAKTSAREAYGDARSATVARRRTLERLEVELKRASAQRGNIPANLLDARELLAEAAGLSLDELPFVGELIEVRTEFEPWREAFNLALGGFATTLLIDTAHLQAFRAAINSVSSPKRLRYEGVSTAPLSQRAKLDHRTLPGRLDYRDTPFTASLIDQLERRFGYVCVDSVEGLSRHTLALTITGQISRRSSGAHGGHGMKNVLGFSSQRRTSDLTAEIADAQRAVAVAEGRERDANKALDSLDARQRVYERVVEYTWEQLDVSSVTKEHDSWVRLVAELIDGAPDLDDLRAQIAAAKERARDALKKVAIAENLQQDLAEEWASVTDEVDAAQTLIDRAEDEERCLSNNQIEYLVARFDPPASDSGAASVQIRSRVTALHRFDAALDQASRQLLEDRALAQHLLGEQREQLQLTFERFLDQWPNPNLRADAETSYRDFERILENLETSGLHELEGEWKQSLIKMSGNDLTNLDSALGRSLREIRERIEPINRIMRDLPFYDDDHRLQIAPRPTQSEARKRFLNELRAVRGLIEAAVTDEARAAAYSRMAKLIDRIRREAPDFADLVDVRNHVRVSAEKVHAGTGLHAALYDHIGEKSGGESQELIAFIVGAALRYQLGDADAARPRYAPVFLDEALIKADAHFTQRAIGAWRGLGFQLIIGAPNDKYSAIEPHIDVEYDILKDSRGRSWARPKVAL